MEKSVVFISHSTPEDNYFAAWLASKLRMLGYEAWVDLDDLRAGESFYTVIQPIIESKAAKFIAVNTKDYVRKAQTQHSGVSRELNCAITVAEPNNFIIPIRVDGISHKQFPMQYKGWDSIDFSENWFPGLVELEEELIKAGVIKSPNPDDPIALWFKSVKSKNRILQKKETYFSNWFRMEVPRKIFIHEPNVLSGNDVWIVPYPLIPEGNRIITFAKEETVKKYVPLNSSNEIDVSAFEENKEILVTEKSKIVDSKKKLVRLLNKVFENHLTQSLVCWTKGSGKGKRRLYYFKHNLNDKKAISLKRYGKGWARRYLTGQTTEIIDGARQKVNWHFAIRGRAALDPAPHYKVFYTVVFTDQNYIRFDKALQQKFRRGIPSDWYNRKWLETLLAAMLKISPHINSNTILISVDEGMFLEVDNAPFKGMSDKGYIEPDNVE